MTKPQGPKNQGQPASVFSQVDQSAIVAKIEQTTADDENSTFFDDTLRDDVGRAARTFEVGVRALTGQNSDSHASPGSNSNPTWKSRDLHGVVGVLFTEEVPTGADARESFILFGPAGVRR